MADCYFKLCADNHMIAVLVSIMLRDDTLQLLQCIKRPKGKVGMWSAGLNKNRLFSIDMSLDDPVTKLPCQNNNHLMLPYFISLLFCFKEYNNAASLTIA